MPVYHEAFSMARQTMFIPLAPAAASLLHPHRYHARMSSSAALPLSSIVLNQLLVNQWNCSKPKDNICPLIPALMSTRLLQHRTNRHCMFLHNRNHLVIR
ncbi:hypothetical protein AZE42_12043 [Rhizopogon vesiculosus]|uniref:Uncharacterized protein n=1 Tax=Rhizopogon vesiculosus TaxID=180088 RepID=A0A1J8QR00_9AGAM|nr:hypothetical protein AZE42_12043 [Rhizopogon vesiculosus]